MSVRLVWSILRLAYVYRSAVHDCIRVALGVLIANVRLFFFVSSYSLSVRVLCRKSRDNDESCRRALTEGKSRSKTPLLDMKEYSSRKSCCLLEYIFMSSKWVQNWSQIVFLNLLCKRRREFHVECMDQWAFTFAPNEGGRGYKNSAPSCPLCKTPLK